ncbi:MAG: hypothetical protein KUG80_05620 [Gammaproteobacteria bacterium]|nr:hypothetical protein [Gammaproteobacteria bacterium]
MYKFKHPIALGVLALTACGGNNDVETYTGSALQPESVINVGNSNNDLKSKALSELGTKMTDGVWYVEATMDSERKYYNHELVTHTKSTTRTTVELSSTNGKKYITACGGQAESFNSAILMPNFADLLDTEFAISSTSNEVIITANANNQLRYRYLPEGSMSHGSVSVAVGNDNGEFGFTENLNACLTSRKISQSSTSAKTDFNQEITEFQYSVSYAINDSYNQVSTTLFQETPEIGRYSVEDGKATISVTGYEVGSFVCDPQGSSAKHVSLTKADALNIEANFNCEGHFEGTRATAIGSISAALPK